MTDFQAIASDPERYADTMLDVLVGMGEDVAEEGEDFVQILAQAAEKYAAHIVNGRLRLFRAMSVSGDWNPAADGLGIHWSLTRERAYPHWGDPDNHVIIEGEVSADDVDVWASLATEFTALTEDEVRLNPASQVQVVGISDVDGEPILPQYVGGSYSARADAARSAFP